MDNTRTPVTTTGHARPHRLADRLLADQHSLPLSLALHLVPGVLIVAAYAFIAGPLAKAIGWPPFLGWAIAMCLALVPFELGLLLWLGRRRNGRFSLRGVLGLVGRPVPRGKLIAIVAALIAQMTVLSLALIPLDNLLYEHLFRWFPFEGSGPSATAFLNGYPHSVIVITLLVCLPLTGLSLPIIEELYFRGFLLPRLSRLGKAAPVVSTVLFSLYHLWSPWAFFSRLVFSFAGFWLAWRKQDLRLSIGMHAGTNFLTQALGVIALSLGFTL